MSKKKVPRNTDGLSQGELLSRKRNNKSVKLFFEISPETYEKHKLLKKLYIMSDLLPCLYDREIKRLYYLGHITDEEVETVNTPL